MKSVEDLLLWVKIKGEFLECSEDVLLCLCYNIPFGSSREMFVNQHICELIVDDYLFQYQYENKCRPDYMENDFLMDLDFLSNDYIEDNNVLLS